ncbi:fumarylacetoacetate hydrolase family protein [Nocardia sp. R6R-6]|uniref:fumarylacetoacetate hydrolase family protein n=1 Tax=Nocardia sp. R6R-6 TaxID=3459303 RepID=UPI00403E31B1
MLERDLAEGELDYAQVRAGTGYAVAALEILDSRIAGWDVAITDTIADNASSGLFLLAKQALSLNRFEPCEVIMRMHADGELVSEGTGAACFGDPLNALAWLARTAREFGEPLRAGEIILSGALGPTVSVPSGARIRAELSWLGEIRATFANGSIL